MRKVVLASDCIQSPVVSQKVLSLKVRVDLTFGTAANYSEVTDWATVVHQEVN